MNYSKILQENNINTPAAFVDLNKFDQNVKIIADLVRPSNLKVRIATKSIRVPDLIARALKSDSVYRGLMCFAAAEVEVLANLGFDDLLLAYPTLSEVDLTILKKLHESGKKVSMVIDDVRQIKALEKVFSNAQNRFSVLIELNVNANIGPIVVGVRRSPIATLKQLRELIAEIKSSRCLKFSGLMAYEAHVAGVGDQNPFKPILSLALKPLRKIWAQQIAKKRKEIFEGIKDLIEPGFIFNGGGTGSLSFNLAENKVLTELTAGSGFFDSHLFDYYSNLKLTPSAFFATQVVRQPAKNWYTCLGGGFVASGEPGWDRVPRPYNQNLKLSGFEGAGEVQTPVESKEPIELGSPIVFRHAKAGELMERFNEVQLLDHGKFVGKSKTYRGLGESYF